MNRRFVFICVFRLLLIGSAFLPAVDGPFFGGYLSAAGSRQLRYGQLLDQLWSKNYHTREKARQEFILQRDKALGPLLEYLNDFEARRREKAALVLGLLGIPRAGRALVKQLDDPVPEVRVACLDALRELGYSRARDSIRESLSDTHPDVRRAAARALGRLGRRQDLKILRRCQELDPEKAVQQAAGRAIQDIIARQP